VDINRPGDHFDALIIGGGPAGLSAAVYLSRACLSVALLDCKDTGRSDWGQINRNYLGFPEGVSTVELIERGRAQAQRFGTRIFEAEVASLTKRGKLFRASAPDLTIHGRAVILATGVEDRWATFPGYKEFVGKTMHWCIVCDGYEMQGQRVLVVGNDEEAAEMALQMKVFTKDVAMLTNHGSLGLHPDTVRRLDGQGIQIVVGRIASAQSKEPGHFASVTLEGGEGIELDHLFSSQGAVPNTALARSLGVELSDQGYIKVDTEAHTNIRGVFAAGDVTRLFSHQVTTAVHEGAAAAMALNYFLFTRGDEVAD
jgi:thioredoxin reductase (NADPH)